MSKRHGETFVHICTQSSRIFAFHENVRTLCVFLSSVKYYKMGRPRTFNYWQSIFVAITIGAASATHKVICFEPVTLLFPLRGCNDRLLHHCIGIRCLVYPP